MASLAAWAILAGRAAPAAGQLPWVPTAWRIEAAEAVVEPYHGRDALLLRNGTAWLEEVRFRDGVVRFDLHAGDDLGFYGVAFRAADDRNYEHIYLRPFMSGNPDASQYTPVSGGVSGWQIYSDSRFAAAVAVPTDRWVHVEVRVRDRRAELRVDGEPVVFPALQRAVVTGGLGLTASGAPARFANVVVSHEAPEATPGAVPGADPAAEEGAEALPAGLIEAWEVSTPFAEDRLDPVGPPDPSLLETLEWDRATPHVRGVVDLARVRTHGPDTNTVFAAVTLRSDAERAVRVRFGYSDRVTVYLDGQPLYRGSAGWRSRDYRFLGTVGRFDEVILPLAPGEHALWFAVSEDFGGWGVTAELVHAEGVEAEAR